MTVTDATLTGRMTDLTLYWYQQIEANKGALGIRQVFDGDRILIAETPTVAVIAGSKERELYGASMMTTVGFTVYFLVYIKRLVPSTVNEREALELTENLEEFMHEKERQQAGGLVQTGMVRLTEPGYADRQGTIFRTARMTWEATARNLLPNQFS